jgi:hypothetical protein
MAKSDFGLLSLGTSGDFGRALNFTHNRNGGIIRKKKKEPSVRPDSFMSSSNDFKELMQQWKELDPDEQIDWKERAKPRGMYGHNLYIKEMRKYLDSNQLEFITSDNFNFFTSSNEQFCVRPI